MKKQWSEEDAKEFFLTKQELAHEYLKEARELFEKTIAQRQEAMRIYESGLHS